MEERKTIEEIIALYSLEDSIRDIYVEGKRDKNFISWVIGSGNLKNSEVYSIEDIEVPNETLDKYGLSHGSHRSRVIAVAMALTENLPELNNALFIVDRDYSGYIPDKIESSLLEYTDYNSVELYALNEDSICKVLAIVYGYYSETMPNYYFEMKAVLRKIFAIRLSNERLGWNMKWLDFTNYVKIVPKVVFQEDRFIRAYLEKNSMWHKLDDFMGDFNLCSKDLQDDCRLSVRGHGFTELFNYLMNKRFRDKKIHNVELFEGFLLSSLDKEYLLSEAMLQRVDRFANGGTGQSPKRDRAINKF